MVGRGGRNRFSDFRPKKIKIVDAFKGGFFGSLAVKTEARTKGENRDSGGLCFGWYLGCPLGS